MWLILCCFDSYLMFLTISHMDFAVQYTRNLSRSFFFMTTQSKLMTCIYLLFYFLTFCRENFKHTSKLKGFFIEYSCPHLLYSTINILFNLLYHLVIYLSVSLSNHQIHLIMGLLFLTAQAFITT